LGRHSKDLLPIMKQIVQELSGSSGLSVNSLADSMYRKHKTRKNYVIEAYKNLVNQDVISIEPSKNSQFRGRKGSTLKLSENVITRKTKQVHDWVKIFTAEQKEYLKILKKVVIIKDFKRTVKDTKTQKWSINPKAEYSLRWIANQMTNIYRHISALGLAYDMGFIPKVYESQVTRAKKAGMKFIKDTIKKTVACEETYPTVLKHHLRSFFIPELIELGYYEQYHESKKVK